MDIFKNTDLQDLEEEIWKDFVITKNNILYDYRGDYKVSNMGRIKSFQYNKERILVQSIWRDWYPIIGIPYKGNKIISFRIHRLVATLFLENPDNKIMVNHKNSIRTDNRAINLEWVNASENSKHAAENNRFNSKMVIQMDLNRNIIKSFYSINEAMRMTNVSRNDISKVCNNKRKTARGYIWEWG